MRISDWSSDVCSSDLGRAQCECACGSQRRSKRIEVDRDAQPAAGEEVAQDRIGARGKRGLADAHGEPADGETRKVLDRKSVVEGKSVSVRVDLGCRRLIQKKNNINER